MSTAAESFGPFTIVRTLGRGGMGEVFLARTPWPDTPLAAVKRLRPDVARIPTFAERFKHEAQLAARLEHPNLVRTLDVVSIGEQLCVATELVLGKDAGQIADRLRERSQGGSAAVALRLLVDGLLGLAYVHSATNPDGSPLGLIHRDVTPGNLMVGYDGRIMLADFGLAKSLLTARSQLTHQGEILGTPHYLPPEVVEGRPAGTGSDIYGLGAVIYRFLTGVAPHTGSTSEVLMKVLTERPRPLAELRPDLPEWCVTLVGQLLEPNPTRRPSDARRLADAVEARARAEHMWVPAASVGTWLSELFRDVHPQEMAEIEALRQGGGPKQGAGTMVLVPTAEDPPKKGKLPPDARTDPLASGGAEPEQGTLIDGLGASRPPSIDTEAPTRAHASLASGGQGDSAPPSGFDEPSKTALEELPELTSPEAPPAVSDPALVTPVPEPPRAPFKDGPTGVDPRPAPTRRRLSPSPLFFVGLLGLAIATGIGVGRLVSWWRSPAVKVAESSAARLQRWTARLERREAAGRDVPAEAWRALARAALAQARGDASALGRHLLELERIELGPEPP